MTSTDEFFNAAPEQDVPRDRWGRRLIDLGNGPEGVTSATTLAGTLEDTYNIRTWDKKIAAKGVSSRPDLAQRAAITPMDDKQAWKDILSQAEVLAGAGVKANEGTSFHELFRLRVNTGEYPAEYPRIGLYQRNIDAVDMLLVELSRQGIAPIKDSFELQVVNTWVGAHGFVDFYARLSDGRIVACDIKTGNVKYLANKTATQLAVYARADKVVLSDGQARPIPWDVDDTMGLVVHVDLNPEHVNVGIYKLDLLAGWYSVILATEVRAWRRRDDLMVPYQTPVKPVAQQLTESLAPASSLAQPVATEIVVGKDVLQFKFDSQPNGTNPRPTAPPITPNWTNQAATPVEPSVPVAEKLADVIDDQGHVETFAGYPVITAPVQETIILPAQDAGTMLGQAQASEPPIDPDVEADELYLALKKSKPKAQDLGRLVMKGGPDIKLAQYGVNVCKDIVKHPNWPRFRSTWQTLIELPKMRAPKAPAQESPTVATIQANAQAIQQGDLTAVAPLPSQQPEAVPVTPQQAAQGQVAWPATPQPAANPFDAPAAGPVPITEGMLVTQVQQATSKQDLSVIWRQAVQSGIGWTQQLDAVAKARAAEIGLAL